MNFSSSPVVGRPPERSSQIVRELRGQINRGDLLPGDKLPTRVEIGQQFTASSETVQRALEELRRDGFITVRGCRGTFVAQQPPHLKNYALVFSVVPERWNRFFWALNDMGPRVAGELGRELSIYFGAERGSCHADFERLLQDIQAQRLGGIIFASIPTLVEGTPILEEPNLPRVAIMNGYGSYPLPRVSPDDRQFWHRAAREMVRRGRHKVALLLPPLQAEAVDAICSILAEYGLDVPGKWMQRVFPNRPDLAVNLVQLLFDNPADRPDGLIIGDDNLVEQAALALQGCQPLVHQGVHVIAHNNFPYRVQSALPVQLLGYNVENMLQTAFFHLDKLREGQAVEPLTLVPAQYETEITSPGCVA